MFDGCQGTEVLVAAGLHKDKKQRNMFMGAVYQARTHAGKVGMGLLETGTTPADTPAADTGGQTVAIAPVWVDRCMLLSCYNMVHNVTLHVPADVNTSFQVGLNICYNLICMSAEPGFEESLLRAGERSWTVEVPQEPS